MKMRPALIEKSDESWELANQLRTDGKFDAAANRYYYSLAYNLISCCENSEFLGTYA